MLNENSITSPLHLPPVSEMLILAGGLGTRLKSVVRDVPKPMAPVRGVPFLGHLMNFWIENRVNHFVLSTGYLGHVIQEYFGNSYCGASIDYICEPNPMGTGGAIQLALQTDLWNANDLIIANGDTWFEVKTRDLLQASSESQATVTIAAKYLTENPRYGGLQVEPDGRISKFGTAPPNNNLINTGTYLIKRNRLLHELKETPTPFSFEQTSLRHLAKIGQCYASIQDGTFLDIGIPEDYSRAESLVRTESKN